MICLPGGEPGREAWLRWRFLWTCIPLPTFSWSEIGKPRKCSVAMYLGGSSNMVQSLLMATLPALNQGSISKRGGYE